MKLFFDARYTRTDYHDGISRYSAELGNALYRLPDFQNGTHTLTFLICDNRQKKNGFLRMQRLFKFMMGPHGKSLSRL